MAKSDKSVGRPAGSAKKNSDAQRIRNVLANNGVQYPTTLVKKALRRFRVEKVEFNKALDVKIAQVRSKMIKEQTGIERDDVGRRTIAQNDQIRGVLARTA